MGAGNCQAMDGGGDGVAVDSEGRDRGGRPTLSGDERPAVKAGVWLPPADMEALNGTITRMVGSHGGTRSEAHRTILMAGVHATSAALDAADEQAQEAAEYMRRRQTA